MGLRVAARWICHFASTALRRSGCCLCWFEEQPEGPSRQWASGPERADLCPLTFEASPKRWSPSAGACRNSRCGPYSTRHDQRQRPPPGGPAGWGNSTLFPAGRQSVPTASILPDLLKTTGWLPGRTRRESRAGRSMCTRRERTESVTPVSSPLQPPAIPIAPLQEPASRRAASVLCRRPFQPRGSGRCTSGSGPLG
jgi:hypothetical protein